MAKTIGNRSLLTGLLIVVLYILAAILGPLLVWEDPFKQSFDRVLESPSWESPFGRDELGRDILSRTLLGARYSLGMAFCAIVLALTLGTLIGLVSGYVGGRTDAFLMRLIDLMLAFPTLLVGLVLITIFGRGLWNLMLAISIANLPRFARLVRGSTLTLRHELYTLAAVSIGVPSSRIMVRHILPNLFPVLLVQITYGISQALVLGSGLSFLGLGAQPPLPEWGVMLSRGREYLRMASHLTLVPGLAIVIATLGLNLLGDGLRDVLDPRTRNQAS